MSAGEQSLFRREALSAGARGWLGEVSLLQPPSLWVPATGLAAATAAIVCFLVFGEYTQRSRVAGQLVPDLGLATVIAPVAGVVAGPLPDEGDPSVAGQPLTVLATPRATTDSPDMTSDLLQALAARRAAIVRGFSSQTRLLELQQTGRLRELDAAERELRQLEAGIAVQQDRVALAEETLAHYRELAAANHASRLQLRQQQQSTLEQLALLRSLEGQAIAAQRRIEQIRQVLQELPVQQSAQAAALARELAEVDQERLQVHAGGEVLVQAPVAGVVASRLIERGQTVTAGQPLLSLLPEGSVLQAQLLVPSRSAGFIEPGDAVELRYHAYPHQKFGHHRGRVLRISRHALGTRELGSLVGAVQGTEPYYRVLVALPAQTVTAYGEREALLPGMLLEADILGEHRKLYEWLLEPLYSLTGRL